MASSGWPEGSILYAFSGGRKIGNFKTLTVQSGDRCRVQPPSANTAQKDWLLVEAMGKIGYVPKRYVKLSESDAEKLKKISAKAKTAKDALTKAKGKKKTVAEMRASGKDKGKKDKQKAAKGKRESLVKDDRGRDTRGGRGGGGAGTGAGGGDDGGEHGGDGGDGRGGGWSKELKSFRQRKLSWNLLHAKSKSASAASHYYGTRSGAGAGFTFLTLLDLADMELTLKDAIQNGTVLLHGGDQRKWTTKNNGDMCVDGLATRENARARTQNQGKKKKKGDGDDDSDGDGEREEHTSGREKKGGFFSSMFRKRKKKTSKKKDDGGGGGDDDDAAKNKKARRKAKKQKEKDKKRRRKGGGKVAIANPSESSSGSDSSASGGAAAAQNQKKGKKHAKVNNRDTNKKNRRQSLAVNYGSDKTASIGSSDRDIDSDELAPADRPQTKRNKAGAPDAEKGSKQKADRVAVPGGRQTPIDEESGGGKRDIKRPSALKINASVSSSSKPKKGGRHNKKRSTSSGGAHDAAHDAALGGTPTEQSEAKRRWKKVRRAVKHKRFRNPVVAAVTKPFRLMGAMFGSRADTVKRYEEPPSPASKNSSKQNAPSSPFGSFRRKRQEATETDLMRGWAHARQSEGRATFSVRRRGAAKRNKKKRTKTPVREVIEEEDEDGGGDVGLDAVAGAGGGGGGGAGGPGSKESAEAGGAVVPVLHKGPSTASKESARHVGGKVVRTNS